MTPMRSASTPRCRQDRRGRERPSDGGINVFDHADIYGGERHLCEKRFGEAVTLTPAQREAIVIQSKVGIRKGYFDFSKEHILATVDGSLAALKTDYLDLLLLHRPIRWSNPRRSTSHGLCQRGRTLMQPDGCWDFVMLKSAWARTVLRTGLTTKAVEHEFREGD